MSLYDKLTPAQQAIIAEEYAKMCAQQTGAELEYKPLSGKPNWVVTFRGVVRNMQLEAATGYLNALRDLAAGRFDTKAKPTKKEKRNENKKET